MTDRPMSGERGKRRKDTRPRDTNTAWLKSENGRMDPASPCPYARGKNPCGGCSGCILPYEKTLQIKLKRLRETVKGIAEPETIVPSPRPLYYRNKVHRVLTGAVGHPVAGIYQAGTHRVIPVKHCLIEDESAQVLIADTVKLIAQMRYTIYDEDTGRGQLRHILVRTAHKTGEVMLVLVSAENFLPGAKEFVKRIVHLHPELTSIVLSINPKRTTFVLGDTEKVLYGPGFIRDKLAGRIFRLSASSFYQINSEQTEQLYQKAISLTGLNGKQTVIDAYCGIATIGLVAAKKAGLVLGAELNERAVNDAIRNIHENKVKNVRVLKADAGRFLERLSKNPHADPDNVVLFLDPPRSGATKQFVQSALHLAPGRIIYISCGPESLARDLKILKRKYEIDKMIAFDMFPYAMEHVETLVSLSRKK